jgi:DNA-binding LytR/AlgR family response regulator
MSVSKIRCLVIDDEVASQKVIEHFIAETEVLTSLKSFSNPKEAYKYLQIHNDVDLIFLDINMPQQQGLEFYKTLSNPPMVIFTTAYPQYAVEGFEVSAVDYLLKPIPYQRFLQAVNKVLKLISQKDTLKPFMSIKENKTVYKVDLESIIYLEAAGDYVKVVTETKKFITHSTFNSFLEQLPDNFLRIHKSYSINLDYLIKLSGNQIQVANFDLPVGQTYKSKVLKSLKL